MKSKIIKILLFLALILVPIGLAQAAQTKSDDSVYVANDEIINGNLYAAGKTIVVDGSISGDLIAVAQTIKVNGRIEGDIIGVAQDIIVNGEAGGNIRVLGNSVTINGTVLRNVNAFGNNLSFGPNSHIGWDMYLAGSSIEARGTIDGGLSGYANHALLAGKVGKDVNLKMNGKLSAQKIVITPEAIINGDIIYTAKNGAQISEKASIAGKIEQKAPENRNINWFWLWLWGKTFEILAALSVGLVLIFIFKNITFKVIKSIEEKPFQTLLPGLVMTFILPPIALVLIFTLIGIPLALIIAAWWLAMIYVAKIIFAILFGQFLIKKIIKKEVSPFLSLVIGVVLCWLLFAIPYVGWILGLIAIWFGLGGIWSYAYNQIRSI